MGAFRISAGVKSSFPYGAFAAITNEPATAAGDPIVPPAPGLPDLIERSLTTYPDPDGGVLVQVIVQNQGDLGTQNGFYTDLYLDHLPTGVGDYNSIHFWVNDPIAAGTTVSLTTVITELPGLGGMDVPTLGPASERSGTLYVQVDSAGGVRESDEDNNIHDIGTEICFASADEYETDDSAAEATVLPLEASQVHNLSTLADEDWFQIQVPEEAAYTIRTSNLGVGADTYLYLYDTDGTTLLAANDDYGGTLASQISWTPTVPGTYYAVVKHWNPNVAGCGTDYTISFAPPAQLYLPLIFKAARPPMPDLVVDSLVATSDAVTVVIKNQGNAPVPDDAAYEFWVDLYINPSREPIYNDTCQKMGCQGAAWGVTWSGSSHSPPGPARQALPLEPGEVFTLTTRGDYYWWSKEVITWPLAQGASVYAQVDSASGTTSYGGVLESNEDNNVSGPFTVQSFGATSPPVPSPDEGPVVVEEKPEEDISKTSLPPRP